MSARRSATLRALVLGALLGALPISGLTPPLEAAARPRVELRSRAEPDTVFVGQQFLYTIDLFTQTDVEAINPDRLPDFRAAWVHELPQPPRLQPEFTELDGDRFGRVSILRRAVFPLRPGPLHIAPASAFMTLETPTVENGVLRSSTREVRQQSNALEVDVLPLPAGAPDGFTGAVGTFRLDARLDRRKVAVGRSLALTVILEGDGNVQSLPDLSVPEMAAVEVGPPHRKVEQTVEGTRVIGRRTWRFALEPSSAGDRTLPPIDFVFFDPSERRYRTARTEKIDWTALPAAGRGRAAARERPRSPFLLATGPGPGLRPAPGRGLGLGLGLTLGLAFVIASGAGRAARRRARRTRLLQLLDEIDAGANRTVFANHLEEVWRTARGESEQRAGGPTLEHNLAAIDSLMQEIEALRSAPEIAATEAHADELLARSRETAKRLR